jgi:phage terminase large subunit-like protein
MGGTGRLQISTDHAKDVQDYIDGVLNGSIVTGRLERLAVHRHVRDLELAGERGFYFDEKKAIAAIEFSRCCNLFEGEWAGKPIQLRPEQKFIVWNLVGWRQKSDGLRRFRQAQIEVARKWGKSHFAAFLACLFLFFDDPIEHGAQLYVAATKQDQAKIVWKAAHKMIEQSPALRKMAKITESRLLIEVPKYDSTFRPIASDSKTVDGFNPHVVIKDEEHAWREMHRGLADTLASGFGARSQPITITITTYGDDDSLIWIENHDYAVDCLESVIDGNIIDDSWFAFICALDYRDEDSQPVECFGCKGESCPWCKGDGVLPIDNPYDEAVWRKANPGIGSGKGFTPKIERMREAANVASQRTDKQPEFFQKNLNIRVAAKGKVITPETWAKSAGELSDLSNTKGYGGIDLGRVSDFAATAIVVPFNEVDDDGSEFTRYEAVTKVWTVADRPDELKKPFITQWVSDGHIEESPGNAVDFMDVENSIVEWHGKYIVGDWAYDKTFAHHMAQRLTEIHGLEMFVFTQSPKFYTEPLTTLLKIVGQTRKVNGVDVPLFKHDGNPCVAWQAGNLIVDRNGRGEMMPDKSNGANKIDVMVAILMALSECLYHQADGCDGYYLKYSLALGGGPRQ